MVIQEILLFIIRMLKIKENKKDFSDYILLKDLSSQIVPNKWNLNKLLLNYRNMP